MGAAETNVVNAIMKSLCDGKTVALWRNVRGKFRPIKGDQNRVIAAGLNTPGASDLIGVQSVVVTPDMVGKRLAIFTAIEVKADTYASEEQDSFIEKIRKYGGNAGVARSVSDAVKILR